MLQVTVHLIGIIVKYGIKYCEAVILEAVKILFSIFKFSKTVENFFQCKSFRKKSLSVVKKFQFISFLSHLVVRGQMSTVYCG